jgi:hypothetical protein
MDHGLEAAGSLAKSPWLLAGEWLRSVSNAMGCGHKRSWPIGEMMQEHGPRTLVSDLWKRWRCAECGSWEVVPFLIARLGNDRN